MGNRAGPDLSLKVRGRGIKQSPLCLINCADAGKPDRLLSEYLFCQIPPPPSDFMMTPFPLQGNLSHILVPILSRFQGPFDSVWNDTCIALT